MTAGARRRGEADERAPTPRGGRRRAMSANPSSSDDDSLEIDLDALAATRAAVRGWRDAHARGSTHLDAAPELFRAATAGLSSESPRAHPPRDANDENKKMDSAVARAVASAPSPRVAAFLRRGGRHASEVAAAPERFCDAAQGVASAAKTCQESLARADEAYDAFVKSLSGGGGGGGVDAVPTGALLAALPLGDDRRTAEQWLWLLTAVLEALARETEVVREVAAYVSRDAPAESRVDDPQKEDPLDAETLAGCAEVWRARAFVDEALLRVLAGAEPPA